MPLKSMEEREHVSRWNRWSAKIFSPPVMKLGIRLHIESLAWWGRLCECIADVRAVNIKALLSASIIEYPTADLIDARCVCVVKEMNLSHACQSVADTLCLFSFVGLHQVHLNKMEYQCSRWCRHWRTKHPLCIILIELFEFRAFPVLPVVTAEEFAYCKLLLGQGNGCSIYSIIERLLNAMGHCMEAGYMTELISLKLSGVVQFCKETGDPGFDWVRGHRDRCGQEYCWMVFS